MTTIRELIHDIATSDVAIFPKDFVLKRLYQIEREAPNVAGRDNGRVMGMAAVGPETDGAAVERRVGVSRFHVRDARFEPETCDVGDGTVIYAPANIYGCRIGRDCQIGPFCEIQRGAVIGNSVMMGSHCIIAANTIIGNEVFFGRGVRVANCKHPVTMQGSHRPMRGEWRLDPVTIGNRVIVGDGAILLPGISIGDGTVIGAGAVVTKSITAAGNPWVGNPARPLHHDRGDR